MRQAGSDLNRGGRDLSDFTDPALTLGHWRKYEKQLNKESLQPDWDSKCIPAKNKSRVATTQTSYSKNKEFLIGKVPGAIARPLWALLIIAKAQIQSRYFGHLLRIIIPTMFHTHLSPPLERAIGPTSQHIITNVALSLSFTWLK